MQPAYRHRIEAIFEAALDRPAEVRSEWLREVCGADPQAYDAVRRLLNAHHRADGILESPPPDMAAALPAVADMPASGRRIGAYRLVREIGRGGMSMVYHAERDDRQYRQQAAVKLVRRGLDTPDLVERFCAERQILASLSHPNIARLLDGGTTDDGLPYLVMEYVAGEPIDVYCDRRRLPLARRLELFLTIARTVQYAHRNLIVHRDLKPSNILVTDAGEIKLLDFGIAKLLDPGASPEAPPRTCVGARLLTPEYASPEQIAGAPVTTLTDVHGLGAVLYRLLTGRHPFSRPSGTDAGTRRWRAPRPPSSVVANDAAAAHARSAAPARLRRSLRGDLDRIVVTALRESPERRYASAEQLALDVEHFLHGRPIRARADSVAYRVRKFVARRRWEVAVAAGFVLLLSGYAATVTIKERQVSAALTRASAEAERAEQVSSFLMRLFEAADPDEVGRDAITARELLERGAARAEQFSEQPAVQAQMLDVIGRTYQHLGQYDRARPLLERALALRRGEFGERHPSVAESLHNLGRLHHARGQLDAAELLLRSALNTQRRLPGADGANAARTLGALALVLQDRGEYRNAERAAREALQARQSVLGGAHPEVAASLHHLAGILQRDGRYAAAEPLFRAALALRKRWFGDHHPAVAESLHDLGYLLQLQGDVDAVEPLYQRALATYRRAFGEQHPAIAATTSNLGLLMFRLGRLEAADSLHREALAMRRNTLPPGHPDIALSLALRAAVQRRMGELDQAERLYRESLAIQQLTLGNTHPDLAHTKNGLALVLRTRGNYAAADSLYTRVLAMRVPRLGANHPAIASTINDRGVLMKEWGRYDAAESLLLHALQLRRNTLGDDHRHVERSLQNLIALYETTNQPGEAARFRALLR